MIIAFGSQERYCAKCLGSKWPLLSDRRMLPCEMTVVSDHCFRVAGYYHRQDVADILRIWGLLATIALGRRDPKPTGVAPVNVTRGVESSRVRSSWVARHTHIDMFGWWSYENMPACSLVSTTEFITLICMIRRIWSCAILLHCLFCLRWHWYQYWHVGCVNVHVHCVCAISVMFLIITITFEKVNIKDHVTGLSTYLAFAS